jgi:GxxExxY protein
MRFELNDNRNECARHGRGPRATFYRMLFPLPPRTPSWPADFQHVELTERIIGVAMQVIRELGAGFVESVYRRAMMVALDDEGLRAEEHVPIGVSFRGREVGHFQGDILVEGKVLLELKAVRALAPDHQAQLINDLKATGVEVGLLLNFGTQRLGFRRVHRGKPLKESCPSLFQTERCDASRVWRGMARSL